VKLTSDRLIWITALFLIVFDNISFFAHVTQIYPLNRDNIWFLGSLGIVLWAVLVIVLSLLSSRFTLKPLLIFLVMLSALTNYFMNAYNIILDETMIQNTFETNLGESSDLLSWKLVGYVVLLGIIPSVLILKSTITYAHFKQATFARLRSIGFAVVMALVVLFGFNRYYTSFFREHKPLRYYTNPTYCLYSTGKYLFNTYLKQAEVFKPIGLDAIQKPHETRKLAIVVVGEAARWNRFSLNGYERQTNPRLSQENIINFSNVSSCGTSTAISVPCMFSVLDREHYSDKEAKSTENVLDVLKRAGISVLWRDNNSDSKGVALRVAYEDYKSAKNNTMCDEECRDEGMLVGLQEYVDAQKGDIVIVLHQMGNHGPAYYKRYPKAFEKFTPVCQTNQVEKCTPEEIGNAYDNVILYTDYFLAKTIAFLKQNDQKFETALIYMADHGESLGEKGLYLHGVPYFMAPEEQTHVGALMWFGEQSKQSIDVSALRQKAGETYSHDDLFHTILGLMNVQTSVYNASLDMLSYKH
jgi:lipid A ethanolaminephosphotransferase